MSTQDSDATENVLLYGDKGPFAAEVLLVLKALSISATIEIDEHWFPIRIDRGRSVLTLFDRKNRLTLREPSVMISYLLEEYDQNHIISFAQGKEWHTLSKELHAFQIRWVQRAVLAQELQQKGVECTNYMREEVSKNLEMLDKVLRGNRQEHGPTNGLWIVGGKFSYVDLVFCVWATFIDSFDARPRIFRFLHTCAWYEKMIGITWVRGILERCGFTPIQSRIVLPHHQLILEQRRRS